MAALLDGVSLSRKFQTTIINDIWPEVTIFSLVATVVTLVSKLTPHELSLSNAMLTVLGTVLGLVISFRTSTAYERFSEGRKLWTNIAIASRNLAQIIWIHVPFERVDKDTGEKKPYLQVVIEKKSMISLVQAYSVAVKHMLRGEGGVYYADLYPLISFLPRYSQHLDPATENDMLPLWKASGMDHDAHQDLRARALTTVPVSSSLSHSKEDSRNSENSEEKEEGSWSGSTLDRRPTFDPEVALPVLPSEQPLLPARSPPHSSLSSILGILRVFRPLLKPFSRRLHEATAAPAPTSARGRTRMGKRVRPQIAESNVPVEIALFLTTYFASLMRQGILTPASATAMNNAMNTLQDVVSNLERIEHTPLPFAYQVHLRLSLWLYLFFFPSQVYSGFGWLTIPATAFAAFLLCGFLEIGQEIENPFNYGLNDLDLDQFCLAIQRELHEVTAHTTPDPDSFIFSAWNQPFAPADRRNANEMLADVAHAYHQPETGVHHLRRTFLKGWSDVDKMTRR
ncbi:Bestrophin, RFP-TM, chloride channel-domain-containing protein [Phanerochaete sordida]|uniref:Bestrophin, RFP-TM, chloride channel-domain-containing protein n=1 Tax=Phanerochaete sordida TaxID=48140 RepID=A0A9P3GHZ9_9APHY|nr:Bestrophin, RFP-TM, chloride channel-domain-containing protein [Phanerochaete sordida]